MHFQSVSELLSNVNYVATRLRHLETIRWHVEWKLPPNELSPKIVLIYAVLLLKCRMSNLRAFLIHSLNFARLFARLTPVFLLKKRPSFARLFTKRSPSEELVTLHQIYLMLSESDVSESLIFLGNFWTFEILWDLLFCTLTIERIPLFSVGLFDTALHKAVC